MKLKLCHGLAERPEAAHEQVTLNRSQREVGLASAPQHETLATQLELPPRIEVFTEPRTRVLLQGGGRRTPDRGIRDALERLGRFTVPRNFQT